MRSAHGESVLHFFFGSAVHVPAPQLAWPVAVPALFLKRPLEAAVAVGAAMRSAGADATGGVAAEALGVADCA